MILCEVSTLLDELKTFISVVDYKSFTMAAKEINLSQPSVSLHIKHLEEYFQTTLIKRSIKQKNIIITESGKLLYDRSKEIVRLLEETKEELLDYSKIVKGHLKIGASFTIGEYFLPSFLGEFSRKYPNLDLSVTIENTQHICEKVKNLELDLGLVEGMVPSNSFIHDYFYKDTMVLALPYNHPLSKISFSSESFQNLTWISREEGSGTGEYLHFFLSSNNIIPKNIMIFGSNYAVKEAVRNNLGATLISSFVLDNPIKNKEVSVVDTSKEYNRNFSYILSKENSSLKTIKVFIEMLKDK